MIQCYYRRKSKLNQLYLYSTALSVLNCSSWRSSKNHLLLIQCYYRRKPKLNQLYLYWIALFVLSCSSYNLSLNHSLFPTPGWHEIDDSIPRFQGKLDRIAKLFEEVQIYQTNFRIPRGTESKSFRLRRSPQMHRKRASSWHVPTGGRWILAETDSTYTRCLFRVFLSVA